MKTSEKAKAVMDLVRKRFDQATCEVIKDSAHLAATTAGSKQWEEDTKKEDWGGGFGMTNPYDVSRVSERVSVSVKNMEEWKEVHKFAEDTFLDMIDE